MDQEQIAVMFRKAELERRLVRKQRLLNELALDKEVLNPTEQIIHDKASRKLRESLLKLEKELMPGYWQRLWAAIRGK